MLTTTVCAALSAAGLAVAFLTAWRRRFVPALRIAAFSLLPVGLALAGLVTLGGKIGRAVGGWAADLVFKPSVWTGFGVLACAVVLYVLARFLGGRPGAAERRPEGAGAGGGSGTRAPAVGTGSPARGAKPGKGSASGGGEAEDFSDIEAILRKHGI
ncbi:hypothetical protein E0L36_07660 [Streptomyces sp. AJS327]|uniref:hypothetical protein n=1 Tax=Streptomyces sp. AJS327 TaxID=2545265 RepID=UPI0015E01321|nr:hypothetical protein [Streptomyces sp. AJS327]MBA0050772.1 hypothetical protein [Streptomyces sp. AJS327]